jgi:hypothetical protein
VLNVARDNCGRSVALSTILAGNRPGPGFRAVCRPDPEGGANVNKVFLTGRPTHDPELRSLASGKSVTQFSV